jgi:hypothetical protein
MQIKFVTAFRSGQSALPFGGAFGAEEKNLLLFLYFPSMQVKRTTA